MKMISLNYFRLHGVLSSLSSLVLVCDSYLKHYWHIYFGEMVGFLWVKAEKCIYNMKRMCISLVYNLFHITLCIKNCVLFLSVSTYRYVAYRQYTYWIHKKLGRKIRIAIPSCVVKKIRESFPSESGSYRGFEYAH